MEPFIQWLLDNWTIVCTNWKLFVSFGVLCCGATTIVLKFVYDNFLYKDLPEKRELQDQINELYGKNLELKKQNEQLEEEHRKLFEDDIFLNGTRQKSTKTAGELISESTQM